MPTTSAGGRRSDHGVKSTTSANRIEAALELIGDRLGLGLQLVGDRARQDVEQQVLRLRLLDPKCREGVPALLGEQGEQREDDRAADRDVEREHRAREPLGDGRRHAAPQLAGDPRAEEHDEIRDVPASRGADVAEHERPERGEDPPQADPAGREETPQRDHRQRRSEQDGDLAGKEELSEVPGPREHDDRPEQDHEVHERHPADGRSEREIEGRPEQRDRQDQHRDQDEKRLAGARVLVVLRIRADQRQSLQHPIAGAPDTTRRAHHRDANWRDRP